MRGIRHVSVLLNKENQYKNEMNNLKDKLKDKLKNRVLQNQLDNYLDDYGIEERNLSVAFEHFCNYCMFSLNAPEVYHSDSLFHEAVHTGNSGDCAIDGIMILINDESVTTLDEAVEAIKMKKGFTAKFFFVQAKTSDSFDSGALLSFGFGVKSFFSAGELNANDEVKAYKEIADYIFENSINFIENPTCSLYYVTTGKWEGDVNLTRVRDVQVRELEHLNYFSNVEIQPIDMNRLMTIYKELNNSILREVVIAKNISFPEIEGAKQAYLGLIPLGEYLKLITDEGGSLIQGVFYDNVRGYLGENPVNSEIISTLQNSKTAVHFPILNNGITIVAKSLNVSGEKFKLMDYQIVNGCQTSNVLYRCRSSVDANMMIPVKIVHSESPELVNCVIRSTNRQTQVLDEAFESLKEFHKQLQEYYDSYKDSDRLYYERRTHEYDEHPGLKRRNIITLPIQLQSYMSMFMGEPHSTHRYYGELLRNNKDRVFQADHKLIAYYTAARTLHSVERAMSAGVIDVKKWKLYRYHILLIVQTIMRERKGIKKLPFPNSREMERLCNYILAVVENKRYFEAVLHASADILQKTLNEYRGYYRRGSGPNRTKEFTQAMLANVDEKMAEIDRLEAERQKGSAINTKTESK